MTEPAKGSIVACANCGARNRLSNTGASGKAPICGKCHQPLNAAATTTPLIVTDANFANVTSGTDKPILLDMWAAWCGPCRAIAPVIEQLAAELSGRVLVGKLDVDSNQRTAALFGVQSIPTLLILQDGREVDRIVGAAGKPAILQRLQQFI